MAGFTYEYKAAASPENGISAESERLVGANG